MILTHLRTVETEAALARMRAEAECVLQSLRASPPDEARVYFWPTRSEQIGLMAPSAGAAADIRIGRPHSHTWDNPQEAGVLRGIQEQVGIPEVEVRFVGDSTHCTSSGNGGLLLISVREHRSRAPLDLTGEGPALGGLPAYSFFHALGLGDHWRRAVTLYATEQCAQVVANAKEIMHAQRARAAHAALRKAQAIAFVTTDDALGAGDLDETP